MNDFKPGQRWVSRTEPELGLGVIQLIEGRQVICDFIAADTARRYAINEAPLIRAIFAVGDTLKNERGHPFTVTGIETVGDLQHYTYLDSEGHGVSISEMQLDASLQFSKPQDRLFLNQVDSREAFNLRYRSLQLQSENASQPFKGLVGPRTALLAHQLYIAQKVSERSSPRVLLADEVGLGKTIEAGLILHQWIQSERGARVLILVPEALTVQWLVEMVRRFNLNFTILDESRCQALIETLSPAESENDDGLTAGQTFVSGTERDPQTLTPVNADEISQVSGVEAGPNPFDAQQLVISSLGLFKNNPERLQQATACHWDMVIVDEAHHLIWSQAGASAEYDIVETLSSQSKGLLLLSATPEQFGLEGHFGRLKLLDPHRYPNFEQFVREQSEYQQLAEDIRSWREPGTPSQEARQRLLNRLNLQSETSDDNLLEQLLDSFGPGYTLFRNRRAKVLDLQPRRVAPVQLAESKRLLDASNLLSNPDADTRVPWLSALLKGLSAKALIICQSAQVSERLEKYLRLKQGLKTACFHEGMDLIARDRAAAYFADDLGGAQALVCSEIGSEGRNFQFAHHLVMFDLPDNADLIEQRIGRLDRIGQGNVVTIHIPLPKNSEMARRFEWFHNGLDLFRAPHPAGAQAHARLKDQFYEARTTASLEQLILESQALTADLSDQLEKGRDLLLEAASYDEPAGLDLKAEIENIDRSDKLMAYLADSYDYFGLDHEQLSQGIDCIKPAAAGQSSINVSAESQGPSRYPELPESGITYTLDREIALQREDIRFLTFEHPFVQQAFDRVLSDTLGNAAISVVKRQTLPSTTLLIEAIFCFNCSAAPSLDLQQYLGDNTFRVLIGPGPSNLTDRFPFDPFDDALDVNPEPLARIIALQRPMIESHLAYAADVANQYGEAFKAKVINQFETTHQSTLTRIRLLALKNPNIPAKEADVIQQKLRQGLLAFHDIAPRLEAIRVIIAA
ncbi:MAG: RNA polymerase-associated protein RapA [Candidatus Azotimanducaceae bacterium]